MLNRVAPTTVESQHTDRQRIMNVTIIPHPTPPPIPFANDLTMVIRSFRGGADVEIRLFLASRPDVDIDSVDFAKAVEDGGADAVFASRQRLLEALTDAERDMVANYLKDQYSTRLTAIRSTPIRFPIPIGIQPLSASPALGSADHIDFAKTPSFSLDLPLNGIVASRIP